MRLKKRDYQIIGAVLVRQYPEIAEKLMPYTIRSGETDFSQIPIYFKKYCEHMQVDPLKNIGPFKHQENFREKMQIRLLFIGAMLYTYNQHIFSLPKGAPRKLRISFVSTLSDCLSTHKSSISRLIDQVISWIHNFPEFRAQIIEIANTLNHPNHG